MSRSKIVAIVQARMGSTRLPGKSAMEILGKPLIWHVLNRVKQATTVDEVVLAVPSEATDNSVLEKAAISLKIPTFRAFGIPDNDLVSRYMAVTANTKADIVVRIPGDNPCVDPGEIDRIVCYHLSLPRPVGGWLTSNLEQNILNSGYPGGLGAEVYDNWFMHWLCQNVEDLEQREHPHLWATSKSYLRTCPCPEAIKAPTERFDVNTLADFEYISTLYRHIYPTSPRFTAAQLIDLTKRIPRPGNSALI